MGTIIYFIVALVVGAILGYLAKTVYSLVQKKSVAMDVKQITINATEEAQKVVRTAEQKAEKIVTEAKVEEKQKDMLDSIHYAKRIQSSLITSEKYIEKNE